MRYPLARSVPMMALSSAMVPEASTANTNATTTTTSITSASIMAASPSWSSEAYVMPWFSSASMKSESTAPFSASALAMSSSRSAF